MCLLGFFLLRPQEQTEGQNDPVQAQGDYVESYLSAIQSKLLPMTPQVVGLFGYYDREENTSYIGQVNATTQKSELIAIDHTSGEQSVRYAAPEGMFVTVAGSNNSTIIFYTTDTEGKTCADIWNVDNVYYGISKGLVSYSGPAGLLIEKEGDLIQDMRLVCEMVES